eukprot:3838203-Prorocentrum_lima.AAC.1
MGQDGSLSPFGRLAAEARQAHQNEPSAHDLALGRRAAVTREQHPATCNGARERLPATRTETTERQRTEQLSHRSD